MDYTIFMLDLNLHYYDLWEKGLKKQANTSIKNYFRHFDTYSEEIRYEILYEFCDNYFNRRMKECSLTFELSKQVTNYLLKHPKSMPHAKWFYQHTNDYDALERAFNHKDCDQETVEFMFSSHVSTLDWGAHHIPEGIIISTETKTKAIDFCLYMIENYSIPKRSQSEFHYYDKLYKLYDLYIKSESSDFAQFCKNHELSFHEIKAYYY